MHSPQDTSTPDGKSLMGDGGGGRVGRQVSAGEGRAAAGAGSPEHATEDYEHKHNITPANLDDWRAVGGFLALNPDIREPLLALAKLYAPEALTFEAQNADYEERREYAERFLSTGRFGHCPSCFNAVAYYGNGTFLSWPTLDKHICPPESALVARGGTRENPLFNQHSGRREPTVRPRTA